MTYKEQLKDPRWQKKRLEIMERDDWQCQCCYDREEALVVHHKKYIKGRKPWEYPDKLFITLCEDCHQSVHLWEKTNSDGIFGIIKTELTHTDYWLLNKLIWRLLTQQGLETGLRTIHQLLLAQIIKKDEM